MLASAEAWASEELAKEKAEAEAKATDKLPASCCCTRRDDFVRGEWPEALKQQVAGQARQVESCVKRFARECFNSTDSTQLRRASFVLLEVPLAAVRPHLRRAERPPAIVDELIRITYAAIADA